MKRAMFAAMGVCVMAGSAMAQVTWTDWTEFGDATVWGDAGGTGVTFTGGFVFANTTPSTDYWASFPGTYTSPTVPNLPGNTDIIGLNGLGGTLTFSTPVTNPVMAIVSLGQPGVASQWHFDVPFVILSQGPGMFGSGPLSNPSGNTLQGNEGDGTIQFIGTFQQISWTVSNGEFWGGFTVGIPTPGAAVTFGLGGLALLRRRR